MGQRPTQNHCHMQSVFLGTIQAMESCLAVAYAVARQWFGVLIRPRTPADAWLVEGLAGYLHDLFLRRFLGKNELRYRCAPPPDSLLAFSTFCAPNQGPGSEQLCCLGTQHHHVFAAHLYHLSFSHSLSCELEIESSSSDGPIHSQPFIIHRQP